jgi:NADH-quinone oxidoreductase subunit L
MISVAIGALGIVTGAFLYRGRREVTLGAVGRFFEQQWYVDRVYEAAILAPARALAHFCADVIETRGIDGAVNGVAALVVRAGGTLRQAQTGYVRSYAAAILAGTIVVLGYWLLR